MTAHKPSIHILKQQNLCAALQQWLDVLLDYDLTIIYRPGVLHVIPDALSRMFMSSYSDNVDTWGTHSNIKIIQAFSKSASPSDFLCQQSIEAIRAPAPVRKRHELPATLRSGGGEIQETILNSQQPSTSSSLALLSILEDTTPKFVTANDDIEVTYASTYAPLFAHLTDEEKLLIAQDKRGKTVPSESEQQRLLEDAHVAGHYGEKAMYAHIKNRGHWWPRMRVDIDDFWHDIRNQREKLV